MNRPCRVGRLWVRGAILGAILALFAGPAGAVGLLVNVQEPAQRLELLRHSVNANIRDGVAVTTVQQTFHNASDTAVDARFTLPVPRNASITRYAVTVAGQTATGDGEAVSLHGGPGVSGDLSVAQLAIPLIPAGDQPTVEIVYAHRPAKDAAGWTAYRYPLAAATEPGAGDYVQGPLDLRVTVHSADLAAMRSPSHRLDAQLTRAADDRHVAALRLTDGSVAEDFVLSYKLRDRASVTRAAPAVYRPAAPKIVQKQRTAQPQVIVVQPEPEIVLVEPRPRRIYVHRDPWPRTYVGTSMSFRIGDRSSLSIGRWGHLRHASGFDDRCELYRHRHYRHHRACDRRCPKRDHRYCR
jgi:hypothetical protein